MVKKRDNAWHDEWRGEVAARLDNLDTNILDIKTDVKEIRNNMNNLMVKVGGVAATVAIVLTLVMRTI